ncbi:MAG TPA: helix-turn-helix domain-containing protein, partial [Vicinamibacteria bacterium]|nr:helix-turn-helix domain-containing protein [Vicinamibacteria bacterium]
PVIETAEVSPLGAGGAAPPGPPSLKLHQNIEWVERETIGRALREARGVKKAAAELLGISQRALSYYLAKYHID